MALNPKFYIDSKDLEKAYAEHLEAFGKSRMIDRVFMNNFKAMQQQIEGLEKGYCTALIDAQLKFKTWPCVQKLQTQIDALYSSVNKLINDGEEQDKEIEAIKDDVGLFRNQSADAFERNADRIRLLESKTNKKTSKKLKIREHRGSLAESMKTVCEIDNTAQALGKFVREKLKDFKRFDVAGWTIKPYCYDERIGWDAHIVTVDGYGVFGFTDGPVYE